MGPVALLNLLRARRALIGSLLCAGLVFVCLEVSAQPTESDADRIARLRDQSAHASAGAVEPVLDARAEPGQPASTVEADAEAEKAYTGNDGIPLGAGEDGLFTASATPGVAKPSALGDGWLMSTLAALGVVLLLVFGIRWLLRRGGIVTARVPQGSVVEVLSRTTVAPRSHVLLMRVGTRILVVNDSTQGMRTLATVQDPDEVAELLGAIDASKPTSITKSFSGVMGRLSGGWSAADGELDDEEAEGLLGHEQAANGARGAVSSVRGRLAALAGGGMKA